MHIESRTKRSALMIVVATFFFVAVAYEGFDDILFPDKIQATYREAEISKEVDQVLVIEVRETFRLDDFGSAYSVLADRILSTDNYAVWAVKDGARIPIKASKWLILDTCEVRLAEEDERAPGAVAIMVRTLGE